MVFQTHYSWKNSSFPVKADVAAAELTRIQNKYGEVTASNLLEESRDASAVLHSCYEWNDGKAAELYRLQQSHHIMSCLTITYEEVDADATEVKTISVRAFENTSDERKGKYFHVHDALRSEEYKKAILRRAWNELSSFRKKYADLVELAELLAAIDEALKAAM